MFFSLGFALGIIISIVILAVILYIVYIAKKESISQLEIRERCARGTTNSMACLLA